MEEVPLITWTQKLVLYETKARYYIVGSNKSETRFRVLKIDRTEPKDLVIHDDKIEYNRSEIRSVLSMIDGGNKAKKPGQSAGLSKNISAFGIAGFVRFLEGYYMILITKRKKAAIIGSHTIYKVEDTSMLYIPNDTVRFTHPDESRYVKMFQTVDLSSNFYFSYSYDLTHSLQYNLTPVMASSGIPSDSDSSLRESVDRHSSSRLRSMFEDYEDAKSFTDRKVSLEMDTKISNIQSDTKDDPTPPLDETETLSNSDYSILKDDVVCGVKNNPCRKFVWNNYLLKSFEEVVHTDWVLYVIHGFIGQNNVCVFGKSVYLTIIGRRSNRFAGTRFLKRGANLEGYVANEIETEQIVQDTSVTFLGKGKISSIVQLRGSIPLFWSQDISKMVPKPPISLDQRDPYSSAAGLHFNQLLNRLGAPIIVLNLVKTRERKRHESILSQDFVDTIEYLNQFLPAEHSMQYIGFDMARVNKRKDADVMLRLNRIARYCLKQTGLFIQVPERQAQCLHKDLELQILKGVRHTYGFKQTGTVRTNCVDCLDRTNTAQFAVGKSALAYQLYALGVLEKPYLEFDTDCVKMLEELYEDHGDTLALQYGGSQLVHRIKSYRKIAPWTSHSRDIMQTLSRYYSNAFSDLEKQQAFNLFLGVFCPQEGEPNLWELPTDYYLHNPAAVGIKTERNHYCQWWDPGVWSSLPLPHEETSRFESRNSAVLTASETDEHVSAYHELYRPTEMTSFDEMYQMYLSQSCWKHMPKNASDFSPFCNRHSSEVTSERGVESNPNISGKDSTSSNVSFGSEGSSDTSEDSDIEGGAHLTDSSSEDTTDTEQRYICFEDLFPSMKTVYDTEITQPNTRDEKLYTRYVAIGKGQMKDTERESRTLTQPLIDPMEEANDFIKVDKSRKVAPSLDIYPISVFKLDSTFFVEPPPVSKQSKDLYAAYIQRGEQGAGPVSDSDRHAYVKYINRKFM